MIDPKRNTKTIFSFCLFIIERFDISPTSSAYAYMNELIYRAQRAWVISQALKRLPIAEGVDRACLFWQWFRHTDWLLLYKQSNERCLRTWFQKKCVVLLRDDNLRFQVPPQE